MKWRELCKQLEQLQEDVELAMGANDSNVAHYSWTRLNRALEKAHEILEAFAHDEEKP